MNSTSLLANTVASSNVSFALIAEYYAALETVRTIRAITGVVDVFGIIGNCLSFSALLYCVGSSSMYSILRALTLADTVFLICHLFFEVLPNYLTITDKVLDYGYHLVGLTAESAIVLLTVLVSVERYVAVCKPLHARRIFTQKRTHAAICGVWLASLFIRIPGFLVKLLGSNQNGEDDDEGTEYASLIASFSTLWDLLWWVQSIPSMLIVTICNVIIVNKLQSSGKKSHEVSAHCRQERKNTRIPLWIVVSFLMSQVPIKTFVILSKYKFVGPLAAVKLGTLGNALLVLNSATNVIIYFACSRLVRQRFVSFVKRKKTDAVNSVLLPRARHTDDTLIANSHAV